MGLEEKYAPEIYQQMLDGYDVLFRRLLPEKVKEFDPGRFIWKDRLMKPIGDGLKAGRSAIVITGEPGMDRNLL